MPSLSPATILSSEVVVTVKAHGLPTAWYTIHPSKGDETQLITFRFSELDEMHRKLVKEVPTLTTRRPPKFFMRNMSDNFIETRREAIEVYLHLVSSDEMATASHAWRGMVKRRKRYERLRGVSCNCRGALKPWKRQYRSMHAEGDHNTFSSVCSIQV